MISNWPYLNLCRHNFDFHLRNTVMAVDLFVVVVAVAATAVVVHVVVAVGKNVQQ